MRLCKHGVSMDTRHDCDYVDQRDALIPLAVTHANGEAGSRPAAHNLAEYDAWAKRWNIAFHRRMDEMWKELRRAGRAA